MTGDDFLCKIIIVDDEKLICSGLEKIITKNLPDFLIIGIAYNGLEALELIKKEVPDVVITDIKMPGMTGLELVQRLHTEYPCVKHVILSGFNDFKFAREALRFGSADYLLKPVIKKELIDVLNNIKVQIKKEKNDVLSDYSFKFAKESFFHKLISGNDISFEETVKMASEFGVSAFLDSFAVLSICIDNYGESSIKRPFDDVKELLNFAVINVSEELLNGFFTSFEIFRLSIYEVVVIAQVKKDVDYVKTAAEKIRSTVERYIEHTVTIGISNIYMGVQHVQRAYNQAKLAVKYRIKNGNNNVFYIGDLENRNTEKSFPYAGIKKIISFIELNDEQKALKAFRDICEEVTKSDLSPMQIMQIFDNIIIRIDLLLKEINAKYSVLFEKDIISKWDENVFEDIGQIKEWMNIVIKNTIQELKKGDGFSNSRIITIIKEHIKNNYFNDITLASVAEFLQMNPYYLSELFKNKTGENFKDYLIRVRIENAKELLKHPDLKAFSVGELVGYENPTYFTKVFKRIVGVTPQKYKNQIKTEED